MASKKSRSLTHADRRLRGLGSVRVCLHWHENLVPNRLLVCGPVLNPEHRYPRPLAALVLDSLEELSERVLLSAGRLIS